MNYLNNVIIFKFNKISDVLIILNYESQIMLFSQN